MSTIQLQLAPPGVLQNDALGVKLYSGREVAPRLAALEAFLCRAGDVPLSLHPAWLKVLADGLGHTPYCLEVMAGSTLRGYLPLAHVRSWLFGDFLVSLPYLNYGGCVADHDAAAQALVDRAVALAEQLRVRYLELRHVRPLVHAQMTEQVATKVHMRLELPGTPGKLWDALDAKIRNQVRKGQKSGLHTVFGGPELLADFYAVFSRNMRDLGTPVYGQRLFRAILEQFPGRTELCVVRAGNQPIAAALLLHGGGISEVPSASSLREHNTSCANMLMYWQLLERTVLRGQRVFDFGRSSLDSGTYRFKKQWGAVPLQANWQYFMPPGVLQSDKLRPDNPRYARLIRLWQRLPVWLTRLIGPAIVRGIP